MRGQRGTKAPLYRKVNTRARGHHHPTGPDFRHARNTGAGRRGDKTATRMRKGVERGLDYTPLYRFLLSKVGEPWDSVHAEAVARLDKEEAIWHLVARTPKDETDVVRIGEASYYSGLKVDDAGILRRVDPDVTVDELHPFCECCTHTFNGARFTRPYVDGRHLRD